MCHATHTIRATRYIAESRAKRLAAGGQDGFMLNAAATVDATKRIAVEVKAEQMKVRKKYSVYKAGSGKVRATTPVLLTCFSLFSFSFFFVCFLLQLLLVIDPTNKRSPSLFMSTCLLRLG